MPNKITYTVQTTNTSKSVEYWNPYTNAYQDANPLTNIPAGTYSGLKARLKGSNPAIIATYTGSVVVVSASGGANPPTISSFSPPTGAASSTVILKGTNLSTVTSATLGNTTCTIVSSTSTSISLKLASNAVTGTFTITNPDGSATTMQQFVVQQSSSNLVVTPNNDNLQFNTLNIPYSNRTQYSVLSEYVEDTDATSAVFRVRTNLRNYLTSPIPKDEASVGIYLDGQFLTKLAPDNDGVAQDFTVNLPGTGVRRLRVVNGAAVRPNDTGDILGTSVEQITFQSGTTHTPLMWVKQNNQLAWWSDSILSGIGSTVPSRDSAAIQLRQLFPNTDITLMSSYGSKKAVTCFGTPTAIENEMSQLRPLFANATSRKYFIALGYNDVGNSSTQDIITAVGNFCDKVHSEYPDAIGYVSCLIMSRDESPEKVALREAQLAIVTNRSYVKSIDLKYIVGINRLPDGVHPDDTGNSNLTRKLSMEILDSGTGNPTPSQGYTGAVAPIILADETVNTDYQSYVNTQTVNGGAYDGGSSQFIFPNQVGSITLRGYARGFKLRGETNNNQYKGNFNLDINGDKFIVSQKFDNPDGTGNSWFYFTSSITEFKEYTVVISTDGTQDYYVGYDGIQWLN